jgi:hypothetical protein
LATILVFFLAFFFTVGNFFTGVVDPSPSSQLLLLDTLFSLFALFGYEGVGSQVNVSALL